MATRLLTPKDLADALGVSESSLKRWIDGGRVAASRTEGGHRRIALADAIRFIRKSGVPVLRPEILGMPEIPPARPGVRQADDSLYAVLREGDVQAVRGWLLGRYLAGVSVAELCDGPIRAAMTEIGELWMQSDDGVFIEHRATDACQQALSHLRGLATPDARAPVAVGATPEGDTHVMPALMVATVLGAAGMNPVNLGADTPLSAMQHAVATHAPTLVCVSATSPLAPARARAVGRWLGSLGPRVTGVVGGRQRGVLAKAGGPSVQALDSMGDLAAVAAALVAL